MIIYPTRTGRSVARPDRNAGSAIGGPQLVEGVLIEIMIVAIAAKDSPECLHSAFEQVIAALQRAVAAKRKRPIYLALKIRMLCNISGMQITLPVFATEAADSCFRQDRCEITSGKQGIILRLAPCGIPAKRQGPQGQGMVRIVERLLGHLVLPRRGGRWGRWKLRRKLRLYKRLYLGLIKLIDLKGCVADRSVGT